MNEIRNLTRNGETFYPLTHVEGVLDPKDEYIGHYEENPEYIRVELDSEGKIIKGIRKDGTVVLGSGYEVDGVVIKAIDNPEFLIVYLDKKEHILWGIRKDGSVLFAGVPQQIKDYFEEHSGDIIRDIEAFLAGFDGDETLKEYLDENYGKYEESPEFVEVCLDKNGRIIYGVQRNGNFIFGAGVPQQIKDYFEEHGDGGDIRDIEAFLAGFDGDETLKEYLEENYGKYEENPEFVEVKLDANGNVLWGIKKDGDIVFGCGIPSEIQNELNKITKDIDNNFGDIRNTFHYISNLEYLFACVDGEDKFLYGVTVEGKFRAADFDFEIPEEEAKWLNTVFSLIDDPEGRIDITLDANNKLLSWRDSEGVKHETNLAIENSFELSSEAMTNFQQALKDVGFQPGGGGDWSDRKNIELPEPTSYALLNITIDSLPISDGHIEQAIAEYYDGLGNSFKLKADIEIQGQTSKIFAETGGKGNYTLDVVTYKELKAKDWEDDEVYYIKDESKLHGFASLPKGTAYREGMYEKKGVDIKFGNWVPQDSFHLKGAAKDVTRGILPTSYKWAYMMQEFLDAKPNRVLVDESEITTTSATGERINDWPNDARCLPDGFPVELYVNGEYYGLYAIQLKKHRKNYSMDKKDYTSFFIDADWMMTNTLDHGIWNDGPDSTNPDAGNRKWWEGFDIKGPKDLICMDGSEFDGDHPKELIDSTSPYWDSANKKKREGSQTTKTLIRSMSTRYNAVNNTINVTTNPSLAEEWRSDIEYQGEIGYIFVRYDGKLWMLIGGASEMITPGNDPSVWKEIIPQDLSLAKDLFNEYFDYNACMLVYIYNCLIHNEDSIKKNTLWGMYSGGKIFPSLWDLDGMYGTGWVGDSAENPSSGLWDGNYATAEWPLKLFKSLYDAEIKAAYSSLRDSRVISLGTWYDIVFNQWVNRIGEEAYNRDIKKWPETPSYRENYTDTEHWQQLGWTASPGSTPVWEEGNTYNEGTFVVIKSHPKASGYVVWMRYKALVTTDTCPVTKFYDEFPIVGGFYDSPKRWKKWIDKQVVLCDVQNDYNLEDILADFIAYRNTDTGYEIACSNMSITSNLIKGYNYIQGHIIRHETIIEGQTVSTYTIDGGAETPEDVSKTYTTVRAAIEAAASQEVDIPSKNVYYIQARAKNINYHKK